MKNKNAAKILACASLVLSAVFQNANAFTTYFDEINAADIQQQIMNESKKQNTLTNLKIKNVQRRISKNETSIKILEKNRESLDGELAVQLQLKEISDWWYTFYQINPEIKSIQAKINKNEKEIKKLNEKRTELDHEYAVLLQILA